MTKNPPRSAPKYTRQDAFERVWNARCNSLVPERTTSDYVKALQEFVKEWAQALDTSLKIELAKEANADG